MSTAEQTLHDRLREVSEQMDAGVPVEPHTVAQQVALLPEPQWGLVFAGLTPEEILADGTFWA